MTTCDLTRTLPTQSPSLEALLPADRDHLLQALASQLFHSVRAADQHLGHLEEQLLRGGHELYRWMLERAAQQKADAAPPTCPHCQNKLRRLTAGHRTTIQSRFGPLPVQRTRGYCKRCRRWRFPADALLGLPETGTQSPAVQEIAALTVSQMPAAQAEPRVERLTGLKISAATLARQAHQQGERAQEKRTRLDQQMNTPLWAEAMRHGLSRAVEVLVVADGAVWIWNLAGDRFPGARQRVDFYHVSQHLWSVAHTLHPDDPAAARAWVAPLLEKLQADASCEVITELEHLRERVEAAAREKIQQEVANLQTHRDRLDYGTAKAKNEPLGSGAMESTCRQYQVRFKRTGQFWSQPGDEALMCLETFRRNDRWHWLFPHAQPIDLSKN